MRKLLTIVFASIMTLTLASCGGNNSKNNNSNEPGNASTDESVSALGFGENFGNGAAAPYFKMISSGTYHMKAKMKVEDNETTMEAYYKDGMTAVKMEMSGMSNKMIFRDNQMYIINDDTKTYMVIPTTENPSNKTLKADDMTLIGSGKAEFNGKNLSYEEYSNPEDGKSQFFFDGAKLVGIRNVISDEGIIDMIISVLDQNVPANAFDIPSGYKQSN